MFWILAGRIPKYNVVTKEKDGKDRQESFHKKIRKKFSEEELEGVRICHVWPQQSLKNFLEINPELTRERINAGYEAAAAQLGDSCLSIFSGKEVW